MIELVHREFDLEVPIDRAWDELADVESWTSWAKHITSARLEPRRPLTATSVGRFRLKGVARSAFRVTEFEPGRRWLWVGRFGTTHVHYDHLFESVGDERTKLTWTVHVDGPGSRTLGRLFAAVYNRNFDKAIPNLQSQLR